MMNEWQASPHRRFNPLDGRWVLVSPHRTQRPWLGERVAVVREPLPPYDPECALCPGNARANGARNPQYGGVYAFDNDYPALMPETPPQMLDDGPFSARTERGACRVVCFSPRHDLGIGALPESDVVRVVDCWAEESAALSSLPFVRAVTAFENRGAMMGASNPHPHGQIWAESDVPSELALETMRQRDFRDTGGVCLLCDYLEREIAGGERVLYCDSDVAIVVPFWAVWPFETLLIPRRHVGTLPQLESNARIALARAIAELTRRYDRLFDAPFPYSMGFHQQPGGDDGDAFHLHAHYYPPLLRDAGVRKHSVGYELLAQQQRDLTPESAARRLRDA